MLGMLQEAVQELLPGEADVVTWLDVLTVAAPQLAGHLRDALIRNWPPGAAASLWDGDRARQYRFACESSGPVRAIMPGMDTAEPRSALGNAGPRGGHL